MAVDMKGGIFPLQCPDCPFAFFDPFDLADHRRRKHPKSSDNMKKVRKKNSGRANDLVARFRDKKTN
jgi:hypothetical protein